LIGSGDKRGDWSVVDKLEKIKQACERKLILTESGGELFYLVTDPQEYNNPNVDPACLLVREELTGQLVRHLAGAWARYPGQSARTKPGHFIT